MISNIKTENENNVYLKMPLSRVIEDSKAGVVLARTALRTKAPEQARAMGLGIEPDQVKAKAVKEP